ncbi:MFS transporter [Diaminobutyricimonas sp. TR449]|uniref:MFS transporter n=1 Tax=Diaminobutyricimonas sp. TR449 TaxID=2708076 RepID=UPI0014220587|nr:MFS transporter [Diaminobutyricimonas sp. TR449]
MSTSPSSTTERTRELSAVYKKVAFRIIPFLFLCFVVAFIDRVNIGFAKLQMQDDLELSAAAYGLGAGLFFVGYVIFELPSNLGLEKWGARKTLMRIMVLWGLTSGATAFVTEEWQFYVLRFFLGVFEAGFAPGVILYLTYWFSPRLRGKAFGYFLSASAVAGIIGSPLSGWIMERADGAMNMDGWRWMLLIEAAPAVILGFLVLVVLSDRPGSAKWLNERERALLAEDISEGDSAHGDKQHSLLGALKQPYVYLLGFVYLSIQFGVYLISFWLPTIVAGLGDFGTSAIGLIAMLPFIGAFVGMLVIAYSSDRTGAYRRHIVIATAIAMVALLATTVIDDPVISVILLVIAATGFFGSLPAFWPLPPMYFSGFAVAGAIALINSIGTTAGFFAPYAAGWVTDATGNIDGVLWGGAVILTLGLTVLVMLPRREAAVRVENSEVGRENSEVASK